MNQHEQLIEELGVNLAAIKRTMMRNRDQLIGELQLTRTQIEVIMLLGDENDQTIGSLADRLAVTHSAATQTIETLVKRELVGRTTDATDRRLVRINLSAEGEELAARLQRSRNERLQGMFSALSNEQLEVMNTVMKQLNRQFSTSVNEEIHHEA